MKISGVITENERVKLINKFESIKSTNHGALDGDATSTHNSLRNINDYLGDEILSRLKIRANDFALTLALRPLDICNTWINIQNKDSVLKFHTHPNSEVSGALYLNVGDDAGSITFMNPNPYVKYQHYETENDYNAKSFVVQRPGILGFKNFDLVILPRHDLNKTKKIKENVVVTDGAPNMISPEYINEQTQKLLNRFSHLKNNIMLDNGQPWKIQTFYSHYQ